MGYLIFGSASRLDAFSVYPIQMCIRDRVPGKIQHGSAWWFNDHKIGMEEQMSRLASLGLLGNFVGMPVSYTHLDVYKRQSQA